MSAKLSVSETSIVIVISEFNQSIIENLLQGALDAFAHHGGAESGIHIHRVPGAFEIPVMISKLVNKYDGFIAIGCFIKGETANFDLISNAITNGIIQISITQKKPIGNSIITSFTKDQASKRFDSGKEAAKAVLEVLKVG